MSNTSGMVLSIETIVNAPIEKIWKMWSDPNDIIQWNTASEDWHTPRAENDLRPGGKFSYRMDARDGSFGFDFGGEYTLVDDHKLIEYRLGDGRKVKIVFEEVEGGVRITEDFETETKNPVEMQQAGWQSILNNFKKYVESH
ncbi:SRPBCC family protein [Chitinophaga sp. Cy-1792]|uniref:SRPBCC family protein n=1 Tax=Chitinophaga sp. Cy-1792 TaxID=2608339 RepID=UPI00141EADE6|nr:SRPBCC family protein [Chitinophaga sp. Cy-1792]NIG53377.1 polyketide cyclase [Chitinophaga sp. Cy-1792]